MDLAVPSDKMYKTPHFSAQSLRQRSVYSPAQSHHSYTTDETAPFG